MTHLDDTVTEGLWPPEPQWPDRIEWMVVAWDSNQKRWLSFSPPRLDRQTAQREMLAMKMRGPWRQYRVVTVTTSYAVDPEPS